jgi:hypothetical protein
MSTGPIRPIENALPMAQPPAIPNARLPIPANGKSLSSNRSPSLVRPEAIENHDGNQLRRRCPSLPVLSWQLESI